MIDKLRYHLKNKQRSKEPSMYHQNTRINVFETSPFRERRVLISRSRGMGLRLLGSEALRPPCQITENVLVLLISLALNTMDRRCGGDLNIKP